jgi:hypothetical protein
MGRLVEAAFLGDRLKCPQMPEIEMQKSIRIHDQYER